MNPNISIKQVIISCITSLICGVIFAVIIPIVALLVLDTFITFLSVFDPSNQGKNIDAVWSPFIAILIIQIIFPVLASVATGISISYITNEVKSGWVYLIGVVSSVLIFCIFQSISIGFVGLFASELVVLTWGFISSVIVIGFSIFIGLICVGVNRIFGGDTK